MKERSSKESLVLEEEPHKDRLGYNVYLFLQLTVLVLFCRCRQLDKVFKDCGGYRDHIWLFLFVDHSDRIVRCSLLLNELTPVLGNPRIGTHLTENFGGNHEALRGHDS